MLQALREYGSKLGGEPGFKTREVRWAIQLTEAGELLNIVPLGNGRAGVQLPRCADMHGMNTKGKSHFIIESAQAVAIYCKASADPEAIKTVKARHARFCEFAHAAALNVPELHPLSVFYSRQGAVEKLREMLAEKKVKPDHWVTWHVNGQDLSQLEAAQQWWITWRTNDLSKRSAADKKPSGDFLCLLSGEHTQPLNSHPVISHLFKVGGDNKGDRLVSFNKKAFRSYGLQDSCNAAMGSEPVQQYVDALNHLLQNQRYDIGGAVVTYWFKEKVLPAEDPLAWLHGMETEEQQDASALAQARKLLAAIRQGERADLGNNHYYGMTISGASGRVMVRDWMEGQFAELLGHIEAWFSDLAIVHREGGRVAPDPKFLAVGAALVRELKDLPASTTSVLWRAALTGQPIPQPIMAQALDRFRAALIKDETFSHARIGLIKAYFVRTSTQGESPMKTHLNPEHPDPAYHCGRLLAVLAKLQHAALGDVGAGVVQRYYPAASSAPGLTLGRLIGNARNHLGKLEGGLSFWYEQLIAEVMGRLGDNIPRTLNLEGQGLFALGYYQQLAALRAGKKDSKDNNESGDQK